MLTEQGDTYAKTLSRARRNTSDAEGDGTLKGDAVMASTVKTRRNQMISTTVDRIRLLEKDKGVTREALEKASRPLCSNSRPIRNCFQKRIL